MAPLFYTTGHNVLVINNIDFFLYIYDNPDFYQVDCCIIFNSFWFLLQHKTPKTLFEFSAY